MHFSFISWGDQMKQTHTSHTYTSHTPCSFSQCYTGGVYLGSQPLHSLFFVLPKLRCTGAAVGLQGVGAAGGRRDLWGLAQGQL